MNKEILEKQIEQSLKIMEQSKDWNITYDEQLKILTEKKELLDKFHKDIKEFEGIQFYLVGAGATQDNIFTIQARKDGQPIATIKIAEDKTTVTTMNNTNASVLCTHQSVFRCCNRMPKTG